jgi:phage-related protein
MAIGGSGPTVAKAYVAIIPTTKDAQKNISKELTPELESAGKDGGEKLSGGIGKSLKSGASRLAGIAKAAIAGAGIAAVTKFVHDSVGAFSQFEQLSGGVQKIFNEIDTSTIISDAQNAYKELGISANEYLKSMTSVGATFAATLGDAKGYDVAKEGLKAISDFASGTGRSVDLLTEKYTLITRATSSYQSIADQFSGILPATSDEFLRQTKEAGLLGSSYQKLTEVPLPEYQEALTKMLTRGVDSMGLLGNSAAEAYTTLEGSTNMMKAAWQNLLVAFGSGDQSQLQSALHGMTESVSAWASNLLPRIGVIFSSIVASLPTLARDIIAGLPGFVSSITDAALEQIRAIDLVGTLRSLSDRAMEDGLIASIVGLAGKVAEAFTIVFGDIDLAAILDDAKAAIKAAIEFVSNAARIAKDVIQSAISGIDTQTLVGIFSSLRSAGEVVLGILEDVGTVVISILAGFVMPLLVKLGELVMTTIIPGLMRVWDVVGPGLADVVGILAKVWEWISTLVSAIVSVLTPTIMLLIDFLTPALNAIFDGIATIFGAIFDGIRDAWAVIEPFIGGIVDDLSVVLNAIGWVLRTAYSWLSPRMKAAGQVIGDVIKGIFDAVGWLVRGIGAAVNGIIGTITGIVRTIQNILSGNWAAILSDAWWIVGAVSNAFWSLGDSISNAFRAAFNMVKWLWNSTVGSLNFTIPRWVPKIGGYSFKMPKLADGGTLMSAGSVLVGERGPEILDLPAGARVRPLDAQTATSETTTYSVTVGDVNLSDDDAVRALTRDYLEQLARLARPGGIQHYAYA